MGEGRLYGQAAACGPLPVKSILSVYGAQLFVELVAGKTSTK